jgi:hypothetical protein
VDGPLAQGLFDRNGVALAMTLMRHIKVLKRALHGENKQG